MKDLKELGNEIALQMMITKRIREPTLSEVQRNSEMRAKERFGSCPAWLSNSQPHPGLPEHYITKWSIEKETRDCDLPQLPFRVQREIFHKLLIIPSLISGSKSLPKLNELNNGTIKVTGSPLPDETVHNIEIFLLLHNNLLPCCYCPESEVITRSASTSDGRVRCYFIPTLRGKKKITFMTSSEKVLQSGTSYRLEGFEGSTPYEKLMSTNKSPQSKEFTDLSEFE